MRELRTEIEIDAPPERIWSVLMDFDRYPAWNPFIREISGRAEEGERLYVRLGPPGEDTMTFKPVVTRAEPDRGFTWRGELLTGWLFEGTHFFELQPLTAGRTRFVHGEYFGGLLVPLLWRSLDTKTRDGFERMNQALKAEAE